MPINIPSEDEQRKALDKFDSFELQTPLDETVQEEAKSASDEFEGLEEEARQRQTEGERGGSPGYAFEEIESPRDMADLMASLGEGGTGTSAGEKSEELLLRIIQLIEDLPEEFANRFGL